MIQQKREKNEASTPRTPYFPSRLIVFGMLNRLSTSSSPLAVEYAGAVSTLTSVRVVALISESGRTLSLLFLRPFFAAPPVMTTVLPRPGRWMPRACERFFCSSVLSEESWRLALAVLLERTTLPCLLPEKVVEVLWRMWRAMGPRVGIEAVIMMMLCSKEEA